MKLARFVFWLVVSLVLAGCGGESAVSTPAVENTPGVTSGVTAGSGGTVTSGTLASNSSATVTTGGTATAVATNAVATTPGTSIAALTVARVTPPVSATSKPGGSATATGSTPSGSITANGGGTVMSGGGLTMKGAFGLVEPAVRAWKSDAVYVSVFNPEDNKTGMDEQGRAGQWYFEVISPAGFQHAFWLVKAEAGSAAGATKTTEDTLSKTRGQPMVDRKLPPLEGLIDTDQLMKVARENGGKTSDRPVGTRLAQPAKDGDPLAFDVLFYSGENVVRLRIDAQSGKLVDNAKG